MEYVTTGIVDSGRFHIPDGRALLAAMERFPDGPVRVRIDQFEKTRSAQANRYYWGVVVKAIADHTGYTPDETHEALKQLFLPKHLAFQDGNGEVHGEVVIGGSTRKMNGREFANYIERIRLWAMETLDVVIPPAGEGVH
ncbi:MAG TPA: recombination protein NinB [Vicinamibacterales bacterium]|nr:recombination protein NinB [Vicinamibacterales bacterium]